MVKIVAERKPIIGHCRCTRQSTENRGRPRSGARSGHRQKAGFVSAAIRSAIIRLSVVSILIGLALSTPTATAKSAVEIGSNLQPFVDGELIDRMTGDVCLHLHKPTPREVVLVTDRPWEGNTCAYYTIFQDGDQHYSVYATEAYYTGPDTRVRRFTYRVDGFVSAHAGAEGGELLTKPLRFSGRRLVINFATAREGRLRIEIQDAAGKPIDGFRFKDCPTLHGDAIECAVSWQTGGDLSGLANRPVRLRFHLKNADLYTLQFRD